MKKILIFTLMLISLRSFSQNGYTLEFESTILLSIDSTLMPANGTIRTRQFTVPAGMVLKINSGILTNNYVDNNSTYAQRSTLKVGDAVISPDQICCEGENFRNSNTLIINEGGESMSPIWANEGTVITLTYERMATFTSNILGIAGCWFGGVLFRKIPN
jgi:hypothetical protein